MQTGWSQIKPGTKHKEILLPKTKQLDLTWTWLREKTLASTIVQCILKVASFVCAHVCCQICLKCLSHSLCDVSK